MTKLKSVPYIMTTEVRKVLTEVLDGFQDDLLEYIISAVEDMSVDDQRSLAAVSEIITPFMLDTGYVNNEDEATEKCKSISLKLGGSGYTKNYGGSSEDTPALLAAPVKLIDNSGLKPVKASYGATFMASTSNPSSGAASSISVNSNSQFDVSAIPTTQKQLRKMKKDNEDLQRILRQEAREREIEAEEIALARMAAIKASRSLGRQSLTGVNIDKFSLPHPSGQGDLLSDCGLVLSPGRRYGLVGKNGAGKSTLLRALAHYKIEGLTHLRIMLVDQHIEGDDLTPLEWVLNADIERTSLLKDESLFSSYLYGTATEPLPEELKGVNLEIALQECYERMDLIGVSTAEARARKILTGLGFDDNSMMKPTIKLSGGWAMRAALAAAVFVKPNLLLLDEPTNHLDLHALVWLEAWLVNYFNGIAVIVSHDRFFLSSVGTDILEFRSTLAGQKKNSLEHYVMDYESFEHELDERKLVQARARAAFEKERDKLKEFISREGRKYDNPQHQSQRKMKMKQLEQLIEVEEVEEEAELVITLPKPHGYFPDDVALVSMTDVDYGYDIEKEGLLFEKVQFQIMARSRIAILGKNGCGKTTLLQLMIGELNPTKGSITRNPGCRIAMLQQHHYRGEQLDPSLNPLEHMRRMPQDESTAVGIQDMGTRQEETAHRSYLANFGVTGWRATVPVKHLSGGQRMRVAMAVALYRRPDCIILDEPTNHLDRDTVRALAEALEKFEGAIIVVSHDEDFVTRVLASKQATKSKSKDQLGGELWVMSKYQLQRFDGSFKDYKKIIVKKLSITDDFA